MKKIMAILTMMLLVLAFGTAYAGTTDILDPSHNAGYVDPETGAANLPASQPLFMESGSAAGGMSMPDTFMNYIDPSKVPGYVDDSGNANIAPTGFRTFRAGGSAAGGIGMVPDTLTNYVDPSSLPGYVDRETGVVY